MLFIYIFFFYVPTLFLGVYIHVLKLKHFVLGGYIFMSMRSKESNQALNSELFHKLTQGWN